MGKILSCFLWPIPMEYAIEDICFIYNMYANEAKAMVDMYMKLGILGAEECNDGIKPVVRIRIRC